MREIIDRALRRQRIAVAVAVVAALLWGLVTDWARRAGGPAALFSLLPVLALGWGLVGLLRAPSTGELLVDERERTFFGPPRRRISFRCFVLGYVTYQATSQATTDGEGSWWLWPSLFGLIAAALAVTLWRRVPAVTLTPAGVAAADPVRHVAVPWEALAPAAPASAPWWSGHLRLPVGRPRMVGRGGATSRRRPVVESVELDVAPGLLAGAVAYYAAHPEHRAAIGTVQEYARLRRALDGGG